MQICGMADEEGSGKMQATEMVFLTPAAGKRLIAKAVCALSEVRRALTQQTVVILAGTTNCYVAEEILAVLGQGGVFEGQHFYRGITRLLALPFAFSD